MKKTDIDNFIDECLADSDVRTAYDRYADDTLDTDAINLTDPEVFPKRSDKWIKEIKALIEELGVRERTRISTIKNPEKLSDLSLDDLVLNIFSDMSAVTVSDFLSSGIDGFPASEYKVIYAATAVEAKPVALNSLIRMLFSENPDLAEKFVRANRELLSALSLLLDAVAQDVLVCDNPIPIEVDVKNVDEFIHKKIQTGGQTCVSQKTD